MANGISDDISLGLAAGVAAAGLGDGLDRGGSSRSGRLQADLVVAGGVGGSACRRGACTPDPRPPRLLARSWSADVRIVFVRLRGGIVAASLGSFAQRAGVRNRPIAGNPFPTSAAGKAPELDMFLFRRLWASPVALYHENFTSSCAGLRWRVCVAGANAAKL